MTVRTCPPCDGDCIQGRDCPAPLRVVYSNRSEEPCQICGGFACDVLGHRTPTYADTEQLDAACCASNSLHEGDAILRRALADAGKLRIANAELNRLLWIAVGALMASAGLNVFLSGVPW